MNIRTATVAAAVIFAACGCGASSPTSPSASTPVATSSTPPSSSGTTVSTQAQPATVEVSLVSVVPGTPSGDGDWCIGPERVTLTAHVVDTSQTEVAQGTVLWEECDGPRGGLPKEACDGHGPGRWVVVPMSDLSFDSTPSIGTSPTVPVLGFRLSYRPEPGGGFKRTTSESFNLDMTCSS
jgi:hypothetical protein